VTRPLSPAFLITAALALVDDVSPSEGAPREMPAAALASRYRDSADGWSAAFVHHAGYWSHFDYRLEGSIWPLPATSSCTELAAFAVDHFVLRADEPNPGDIYLLWSPAKKLFVRAGIILGRTKQQVYPSGRIGYECVTIDADTTLRGTLRGPCTAIVRRMLCPAAGDRWVRWPLLDVETWEQPSFAEWPSRRAA
jgi:hypothetical protein